MADDFETLLAIQDLDTAADVLRHRRAVLPERGELKTRMDALAVLEADLVPTRERRHEVERSQKAIEDEIGLLGEKRSGVEAQMYGGSSSNAKELQALQDEINAIDRRRARLEDDVLERMLELEPLDAALNQTSEQRAGLDREAVELMAKVVEAETAIDADLAELEQRRAPLVDLVPADLLARYEKLRSRLQGVAIARLEGTKCTGCHLALPAAEVEAVRRQARDQGIGECPECDRLLVV